ncbi:hypothetical protein N798_08585 [Knoellia flava TL1]|nr:hypothetical protein N798_08585 [Knoellia flava TL1]
MVPGRQEPGQPEGDPVVTSHVVDSGLLRTMSSALWTVTCAEYPYGVVRLESGPRLTQVVVGDDVDPANDTGRPAPYAAASCTTDGELVVVVRDAPPAIVVTIGDCRTRPLDGAEHDSEFPQEGERLILLSCAVFEAVPDVLVDGVNGVASGRLATEDPESLLIELVGGAACGAGAIIDRRPADGSERS